MTKLVLGNACTTFEDIKPPVGVRRRGLEPQAWQSKQGLPDSKGNARHALYLQKFTETFDFAAAYAVSAPPTART
jgi:hypothetical protein